MSVTHFDALDVVDRFLKSNERRLQAFGITQIGIYAGYIEKHPGRTFSNEDAERITVYLDSLDFLERENGRHCRIWQFSEFNWSKDLQRNPNTDRTSSAVSRPTKRITKP